jgi:hypothetical protein
LNNPSLILVASDEFPTNLDVNPVQFPPIGSGYRISSDSGKSFSAINLGEYSVYDFIQDPNAQQTLFASVHRLTLGGISISKDGGKTWDSIVLKCQSTSQPIKLLYKGGSSFKYFGAVVNTSHGFFTYTDTFKTCSPNSTIDVQSRDIALSPKDSSLLFLAADGVYSRGVYRSYNQGATWSKDEHGLENINVSCIIPSPIDPAIVLCGSGSNDGGIYKSIDTGTTWQKLTTTNGPVYSIVQHPLNPKFMIAAIAHSVYASNNYGNSWEPISSEGLPVGYNVRKVALPPWDKSGQGYIAFISIDSNGLYRSQPLFASVDDYSINNELKSSISIFPQPAINKVSIQFINPNDGNVKIEIKDCLGRNVGIIQDSFLSKGFQNIIWNISPDIPADIYFAIIHTNQSTESAKIVIFH